jgi:hypothetical protein
VQACRGEWAVLAQRLLIDKQQTCTGSRCRAQTTRMPSIVGIDPHPRHSTARHRRDTAGRRQARYDDSKQRTMLPRSLILLVKTRATTSPNMGIRQQAHCKEHLVSPLHPVDPSTQQTLPAQICRYTTDHWRQAQVRATRRS